MRASLRLPIQTTQLKPLASQAILLQASDWTFLYDLVDQLQFQIEAAVTSPRQDIASFSHSSKTMVLLELTVPQEDNVHLAHDKKNHEILCLSHCLHMKRCQNTSVRFEVGCLGYCPHSFLRCACFEALGLPKSAGHQIRSKQCWNDYSNIRIYSNKVSKTNIRILK